jgi:predicted GH43/DUF377 family glycosyl hydrolase
MSFVKKVLEEGGSIKPLIIPSEYTNGTGLLNPSVFVDEYNNILINIRHIQYTLYHAELNKYEHQWGPLVYLHPENDLTLTTTNYICKLDDNLDIEFYSKVDTSELDKPPLWEFVGLEDCRLVKWENKLYICGVRRDTTTNGQGRMELSEIVINNKKAKEISRVRIPAPGENNSYCEKNWMPIIDKPYHFVKWTNPTEVVKFDIDNCTTEQIHLGEYKQMPADLRGGSQVIPYKDGYLTLNHETYLYNSEAGRKDGTYRHRFTYWDKNWNVISFSENFHFLGAKIEFSCGIAKYKNDFIISFGFQDNAAYVLRVPEKVMEEMINVG